MGQGTPPVQSGRRIRCKTRSYQVVNFVSPVLSTGILSNKKHKTQTRRGRTPRLCNNNSKSSPQGNRIMRQIGARVINTPRRMDTH